MGQFEGLKDFDVAALGRNASATTGRPRELPVARIERDPDNIRKSFDEAAVIQLAETIKADGLLQAITVRRNIHKKDYFIISYGERRFRAVCLLGRPTIAAVIDDNFDPYRQAIENLQREELDPLDIADWVQRREEAGDSRTTIAKRLGKPKSYISEIALLIKAPPAIREAFRNSTRGLVATKIAGNTSVNCVGRMVFTVRAVAVRTVRQYAALCCAVMSAVIRFP